MKTALIVTVIILAVIAVLYLLMIMPRMFRRPDRTPFMGVLYAHRGLHDNKTEAPENSMAAFKKAVEAGFGIELDVQLAKDKVLELARLVTRYSGRMTVNVVGFTDTVQVNPVIVTEIIEVADREEMDYNDYFVATESVFEFRTAYEFTSQEYPIDSGRMTKLVTNTEQFARIDSLEVDKNG